MLNLRSTLAAFKANIMHSAFPESRSRAFCSGGGLNPSVRRRNNWNDYSCSYRSRLVEAPKPIPVDNNPQAPPARKVEGILKTVNVNVNAESNRKAHHTDEYEVLNLVVRRGQAFEITVTYDRAINDATDEIKFIFQTGDNPKVSKDTEIHVTPGKSVKNSEWGAQRVGDSGNDVTYKLMTPANAVVDEWSMIVQTIFDHKNEKMNRYRYKVKDTFYVLFNAWCKEDTVYMANEEERQEYVLEQIGLIWRGSAGANGPMMWNYKQFDDVCLDGSLFLLKKSGLSVQARSNPALTCRALSQMANSNDNDGGVLSGNWSGNYLKGIAPSTWQGSGSIMEQYMRTKSDVKWAQCWVFSGLLTTLCRAIGIPTRSVTNFESAHDIDSSMTIDTHYDSVTLKALGGAMDDSVWNFHVWNESYMKRLDLPDGYDGWQAHDSTPQEVSEHLMRCGPAPVIAIKNGDVHINYDSKFVFAEVNGDRVSWIVEPDGNMIAAQSEIDTVGKEISTKAVGRRARNDVTHEYKHAEGSEAERAAVDKAMKYSSRREFLKIDESKNDCAMTLDVRSEPKADITAMIRVTNNSNEERNVKLNIQAVASYYTGMTGEDLKTVNRNLIIAAKGNDKYEMKIPAAEWINTIDADATVKVFVTGNVSETGQVMTKQKAAALDKPELDVTATPPSVTAGEEFEVTASFTNHLDIPVNKGVFTMEGPGSQRSFDVEAKKSIAPGEKVTGKAKFTPRFAGKKEVVVGFNSRQLTGISGATSVVVKKK
ncbi:protein-glutamine gamma-glutamyltransferase K-like isoform X2 [Lineus longissimus]|uniref:protein-glutamine gamma-glutamyltransferase K-like isoform X2 n=1 Tax=Lineus longissimus TaxID=88925 RepID=UPI002B4CF502